MFQQISTVYLHFCHRFIIFTEKVYCKVSNHGHQNDTVLHYNFIFDRSLMSFPIKIIVKVNYFAIFNKTQAVSYPYVKNWKMCCYIFKGNLQGTFIYYNLSLT